MNTTISKIENLNAFLKAANREELMKEITPTTPLIVLQPTLYCNILLDHNSLNEENNIPELFKNQKNGECMLPLENTNNTFFEFYIAIYQQHTKNDKRLYYELPNVRTNTPYPNKGYVCPYITFNRHRYNSLVIPAFNLENAKDHDEFMVSLIIKRSINGVAFLTEQSIKLIYSKQKTKSKNERQVINLGFPNISTEKKKELFDVNIKDSAIPCYRMNSFLVLQYNQSLLLGAFGSPKSSKAPIIGVYDTFYPMQGILSGYKYLHSKDVKKDVLTDLIGEEQCMIKNISTSKFGFQRDSHIFEFIVPCR